MDPSTEGATPHPAVTPLTDASSIALDFSRGVAAQVVVIGHGLVIFRIADLPWLQNSAVLVFFILSGFIIPYSTFRKAALRPEYRFGSYFVERLARIYTAFLPALVFVLVADVAMRHFTPSVYIYDAAFDVRTFLGNLLMLQDHALLDDLSARLDWAWLSVTSFGSARPFWTVAIEWWIYLLFGWLVLPTKRHRGFMSGIAAMLVLSIVPVYNVISGRGHGLTMVWMLGMAVFFLADRLPGVVSKRASAIATIVFIALAVRRLERTLEAYDLLFAALLAAAMVFALLFLQQTPTVPRWVPVRAIRFNASFSYSLYLVHYTVLVAVSYWNGLTPRWVLLALGFAASNVVAIVLRLVFERHYRAVGNAIASRVI